MLLFTTCGPVIDKRLSIMRHKVTIVGAGNVGGMVAQRLAQAQVADIVLMDAAPGLAGGKVLDLLHAGPVCRYDTPLIGTSTYDETAGSSVVAICAGLPRKPGMSRDALLKANTDTVKAITQEVVSRSPNAILLIVSNPLDVMSYVAYKTSGFPKARVVGMAGVLDSARLQVFIALELGISAEHVQATVLGGHGDDMVPLLRYTTVSGIPVTDLISPERLTAIIQRTQNAGAEVLKLLQTGSAYFAPSAAVAEMVTTILRGQKRILSCSALCQGEYKVDNLFSGVPVQLGEGGVEKIIEMKLTPDEEAAFRKSVKSVEMSCRLIEPSLC